MTMPNWTSNKCEITGDADKVNQFMNDIKITDDRADDTYFIDMTQVNPIPDVFKNMHTGSRTIDEIKYSQWFEIDGEVTPLLELNALEITEKHGTCDPVDWQYRNWGTKWGDCQTVITSDITTEGIREVTLVFDSAWGEPWMLLNDIAEKYNINIMNTWLIETDQGDGVSQYPIVNADELYRQYVQDFEQMKMDVKNMGFNKK
jgi:hypothetical protein